MSKKILLQFGNGGHEKLLRITAEHHAGYCSRQGYEFYSSDGWYLDRNQLDPVRSPMWEKIRLILGALRDGYETIVWLDADCLIVRQDVDLAEALDPFRLTMPIGMVRYDPPYAIPGHWNTGAIYLRAGNDEERRELIRLFEDAWADWPSRHPWEDQNAINRALAARTHIAAQWLDYKWNCTPNLPCDAPVVKAWHGHDLPTRIRVMTEEVSGIRS